MKMSGENIFGHGPCRRTHQKDATGKRGLPKEFTVRDVKRKENVGKPGTVGVWEGANDDGSLGS